MVPHWGCEIVNVNSFYLNNIFKYLKPLCRKYRQIYLSCTEITILMFKLHFFILFQVLNFNKNSKLNTKKTIRNEINKTVYHLLYFVKSVWKIEPPSPSGPKELPTFQKELCLSLPLHFPFLLKKVKYWVGSSVSLCWNPPCSMGAGGFLVFSWRRLKEPELCPQHHLVPGQDLLGCCWSRTCDGLASSPLTGCLLRNLVYSSGPQLVLCIKINYGT